MVVALGANAQKTQSPKPRWRQSEIEMPITYKPVITRSAADQIAEQIQAWITDGILKADEKLPTETELAEQFDVSRPTIREALKRLAAKSLIRSRRGPAGGSFVNAPNLQDAAEDLKTSVALMVSFGVFELPEVAEARHEMERVCARLAATRRTEQELDRMAEEIGVQKNPDLADEEFCASDIRFHRALADASHNPVLQFQMFTVIEALQPAENMVIFRFRQRDMIIDQHEAILRAIREKNADRAEAAVDEQMRYLRERFERAQEWRENRMTAQAN